MSYYQSRKQSHTYYDLVRHLLRSLGPQESILDVGPADTPVATWGEFKARVAIDLKEQPPLDRVIHVIGDYLDMEPATFSVITCLQMLEHLEDPRPYTEKLIKESQTLIVSVPHMWPKDTTKSHKQDPISLKKFLGWFDEDPTFVRIVRDGCRNRLVAMFAPPKPYDIASSKPF